MSVMKSGTPGETLLWVYILKCGDGSLYTGMTTDLGKRLRLHRQKKARCKFTRRSDKHPLRLGAAWALSGNRGNALTLEHYIKKLSRSEKLLLLEDGKALKARIGRDALQIPCEITPYQGALYELEEY